MTKGYKAAVFDMDGTILDTIEDLKNALNHAVKHFGFRGDHDTKEVCRFFGSGAKAAIIRALLTEAGASEEAVERADSKDLTDFGISEDQIEEILVYYKPYYASHAAIETAPFPGIPELLKKLSENGIRTAVVSNKADRAVHDLCDKYFPGCFDYIIGETDGIRRKPAPDMLLAALDAMELSPEDAVYIGDSEVDVQTAQNAGLTCLCLDWGFRTREYLEDAGAETILSTCEELENAILHP